MRLKTMATALAVTGALAAPAAASAHDGIGDWDTAPYCGTADGGFLHVTTGFMGVTFDRFSGNQWWVTPGAPGDYPRWHKLVREYHHFYFGYRYTATRDCGWFFF